MSKDKVAAETIYDSIVFGDGQLEIIENELSANQSILVEILRKENSQ